MNAALWVSDWEPVTEVVNFHTHGGERCATVTTAAFAGIPAGTVCAPVAAMRIEAPL